MHDVADKSMAATASSGAALATRGIDKRYGGTHALRAVDVAFRSGEVHALVGENGAGKSTLTRILTGATRADAGQVIIDGRPVELRDPIGARRLGIRLVHQHDTLVSNLSVAENILLGHLPKVRHVRSIDWAAMRRIASGLLAEVGYPNLDVGQLAGRLPASLRQVVEIAKAVSIEPRVLILDEPTAAFAQADIERLFAYLRRLRERHKAIVYISHRLDEIFALADRVTVLRDGAVTGTVETAAIDKPALIRMMVGRSIDDLYPTRARPPPEPGLSVRGLSRTGVFDDVSFDVGAGEIVGMYGLVGSGRTDVVRCLFGADRPTAGTIRWQDRPLASRSPREALSVGIALLTEDRLGDGLVRGMSLVDNASLASLRALSRLGVIDRRMQRRAVSQQVAELAIRPPELDRDVALLSGGNQQKVVLAKWLLTRAKLLILDEPTRGVDVAARRDLYVIVGRLADAGLAVLLVSSDLPEVLGMADRTLVMREGRIAGTFERSEASEERLLACASGLAHG